jgi:hypothetical protein
MCRSFQPHQLDYDWRFNAAAQARIANLVTGLRRVLLLGCPSLTSILSARVEKGVLLERNPNHQGTDVFAIHYCDLREQTTLPRLALKFDLAILDAPWYLDDLLAWLKVALSAVSIGTPVLFVLWPESTRPTAAAEHEQIWSFLRDVGEINILGAVYYETPLFEKITLAHSGLPEFVRSGTLVKSRKEQIEYSN